MKQLVWIAPDIPIDAAIVRTLVDELECELLYGCSLAEHAERVNAFEWHAQLGRTEATMRQVGVIMDGCNHGRIEIMIPEFGHPHNPDGLSRQGKGERKRNRTNRWR